MNADECEDYDKRCLANLEAVERLQGRKLTDQELSQLGIMIYQQIAAERKVRNGHTKNER